MSYAVQITSDNYLGGNQFQVSLPGNFDLSDYDCSVETLFIYYAWNNISVQLNNNQYRLTIPTATPQTLTITIPDGIYEVETINAALQYWFQQNGFYLQNPVTLEYFYFAAFVVNPTTYKVDFITTALPSAVGSLDTACNPKLGNYVGLGDVAATGSNINVGSGFHNNWPTTSNQVIQLTTLSSNTFSSIIGFPAGTYPASPTISGTVLTTESTQVPNVNPINSVQCRVSCIHNKFSPNSQVLHTFSNGQTRIGAQIDASPKYYKSRPCIGIHNQITFSLFDQNGRPLGLIDPNVDIQLGFLKTRNLNSGSL